MKTKIMIIILVAIVIIGYGHLLHQHDVEMNYIAMNMTQEQWEGIR